jgi:hypothetical protein
VTTLIAPLVVASRHARLLLVAGLFAGLALPDFAVTMRPWLSELVAGLLFLAALRIGPRKAFGALSDLPGTLGFALLFQLVLPLAAIAIAFALDLRGSALPVAIILMLSAPSISGSPNLTIMTGHDAAPALRLLIIGTAILPLTVIPIFWLLPELGSAAEILRAAGRLLVVIGLASVSAFALRGLVVPNPSAHALAALDGASAIALAVVVVGLMSAAGPALVLTPIRFCAWLGMACAANFSLQIATAFFLSRRGKQNELVPFSIIAGNRNIALFLVALPPAVTNPLLLFIGCYQIPMYLTPIIMRQFYAHRKQVS